MDKKFKKEINALNEIFDFVAVFGKINKLDESISFAINLAIEEIFTNMVKYNSENDNEILINIKKEKNRLKISLTDFDVEPFDIRNKKEVRVNQHIANRKVGGLGIHLVKQMVDKIDYKYEDRKSTITLIKKLEK